MTRPLGKVSITVLGLALFVLVTQGGALSREVIDWDESTFILIAGRLLDGYLPYADLFDNKPPLIFFQFAAVMAVFGEHLASVRLFGDACILAIVLLTIASLRRFVSFAPAVASGILLAAVFAIWPGQYTSAELPAMAMILGAQTALLWARDRGWAIATAGVLISLATLTRTNLAVVAVALCLWITLAGLFFPQTRVRPLAVVLYTVVGLVPVGLLLGLYASAGALDDFILATVTVPLSYASSQLDVVSVVESLLGGWAGLVRWTPLWLGSFTLLTFLGALTLLLMAAGAVGRVDPTVRQDLGLVSCFGFAVLVSVVISGVGYLHYWLHLLPFAAMLAGAFLAWAWRRPASKVLAVALVALSVLGGLRQTAPALVQVATAPEGVSHGWTLRRAAARIDDVLQPEDTIWAVQGHLILWYLDRPPVSRAAAHPDNIARAAIIGPLVAAGYVEAGELARIYNSHPAFIVAQARGTPSYLQQGPEDFEAYLREGYAIFFEAEDVVVYRRLDHGGWRPEAEVQ